jgi:alkylhydroperoxidase family enzyme
LKLDPSETGRGRPDASRNWRFGRWAAIAAAGALLLLATVLPMARTPSAPAGVVSRHPSGQPPAATNEPARLHPASDAEAWASLPERLSGEAAPLPAWARILARSLPRTTAAMLELDHLHRSRSPLDPELRGQIRWVAARAIGSAYGEACALADLRRAGLNDVADHLAGHGPASFSPARQAVLDFAATLTSAPQSVTDAEVARLIAKHGEKQVVAMVLLVAHANFQDRLLLALGVSVETGGPLPSANVRFARRPFGIASNPPLRSKPDPTKVNALSTQSAMPWTSLDVQALRHRLDQQRARRPRIRLPEDNTSANRWGLVGQTYQPELATAWSSCTQAFGEEANQDPVFEQSLFWVVTGTKGCFY